MLLTTDRNLNLKYFNSSCRAASNTSNASCTYLFRFDTFCAKLSSLDTQTSFRIYYSYFSIQEFQDKCRTNGDAYSAAVAQLHVNLNLGHLFFRNKVREKS